MVLRTSVGLVLVEEVQSKDLKGREEIDCFNNDSTLVSEERPVKKPRESTASRDSSPTGISVSSFEIKNSALWMHVCVMQTDNNFFFKVTSRVRQSFLFSKSLAGSR